MGGLWDPPPEQGDDMAQFQVKDIRPNPFRHVSRYPIRRDKIAALRESLRSTGFWGNIVARLRDGQAEIAYGHHRLVALKEEYGPSHKVDLIVRELSDEAMLQIMARENMEEWGTSASVEHETIRAVIVAYAQGKIELPSPDPATAKAQTRYAPSFVPGDGARAAAHRPYTAQTVAKFIGWLEPSGKPQDKVSDALTALQFIEEGLLKESDFEGLTTMQAAAVVEEARKARSRREALALLHRQEAEQAQREAKLAEQRREQAEKERHRKEAEAAAARDAEVRRRAQQEAKLLAQRQREAEQSRRLAVERERRAKQKEEASVKESRRRAEVVGRAVSESLKTGKIGYKQAPQVAAKVEGKRGDTPLPHIDDYTRRLAADLNVILDPDRDARVVRLRQLIPYAEHVNEHVRTDLIRTLEVVADRAQGYARQLRQTSKVVTTVQRSLPPGG